MGILNIDWRKGALVDEQPMSCVGPVPTPDNHQLRRPLGERRPSGLLRVEEQSSRSETWSSAPPALTMARSPWRSSTLIRRSALRRWIDSTTRCLRSKARAATLLKIEGMPEHSIIVHLRELRRARVRYGRANLYIIRWGEFASGDLGAAVRAFEDGEGTARGLCTAFVRSRIESHTPSFDFARADLSRLVDLVAAESSEPELQARTIDGLTAELVDLAGAERERARKRRAKMQKLVGSRFDYSTLSAVASIQASLGKWKLGSIYEPKLSPLLGPLPDSAAQLGAKFLETVKPSSLHVDLGRAKAPSWAGALKKAGLGQEAGLAVRQSLISAGAHKHLDGYVASLGQASFAGLKPSSFASDGAAPPWFGAIQSAELAGSLEPRLRNSIAEIATNFSQPGLRNRFASLGIAAQIGDLNLGASLSAGILPKDLGFAALAQSQLGLLPRLPAWKEWTDSFEQSLPTNWRDLDAAEVDRAAGLMGNTGLCLAWVPRAELIRALLAAPDHEDRCQVLVANANEILVDVEAVLLEVSSEELAPIAGAAEEAIRSARAGAPGPAQSHVASALGHIAHGYFGYKNFGPVRERFADVDPINDVGFAEFSFYAIGRAWVVSVANFMQAGDGFNRNFTAHYVGAPHYSEANFLAGLMLLAGLARELQRQECRLEARQLQAA